MHYNSYPRPNMSNLHTDDRFHFLVSVPVLSAAEDYATAWTLQYVTASSMYQDISKGTNLILEMLSVTLPGDMSRCALICFYTHELMNSHLDQAMSDIEGNSG